MSNNKKDRVLRGGAWNYFDVDLFCMSYYNRYYYNDWNNGRGFRCIVKSSSQSLRRVK